MFFYLSFKFCKDLSFCCGDILLFVTVYDLELKILSFLESQKNAILNIKIRYILFYYIGSAQRLSVNSRKKRIVNPIKIEVTRRARTEMILGKSPVIFNGHQPPRADYTYTKLSSGYILKGRFSSIRS